MDTINVNYRWTNPAHVKIIKDSCICRSTGIYELYVYDAEGQEVILLIDTAFNSFLESLNTLSSESWYKQYEDEIFIRFAFITFPYKWVANSLTDIRDILVDIYKPMYNTVEHRRYRPKVNMVLKQK